MAVRTTVDGSPTAPFEVATWLRGPVTQALQGHGAVAAQVRGDARADWDGDASEACVGAMTVMVDRVDEVAASARHLADLLEQHADTVRAARRTMALLRAEASAAGLRVTPDRILRPEPGGPADAVYVDLARRAEEAASLVAASGEMVLNGVRDSVLSWTSYASGAVLGAGVAFNRHLRGAREDVGRLMGEERRAEDAYLRSPGGSDEARFQESRRHALAGDVARAERHADELADGRLARLVGGRLPVLGAAITVVGVGYDLQQGADPSGAIVGAAVGTVVSGAVAAVVAGPVLLAAGLGVGAGIVLGLAAEAAWDHFVPDEFRAKVDDGLRDLWEAAARGVDDLWGAIF